MKYNISTLRSGIQVSTREGVKRKYGTFRYSEFKAECLQPEVLGVQTEEPALKNPPDIASYIARKTGHLAENGFHSRIRRLEWRIIHFCRICPVEEAESRTDATKPEPSVIVMLNGTEIGYSDSYIEKIVRTEIIVVQAIVSGAPYPLVCSEPYTPVRRLMNILKPGKHIIIGFTKLAPVFNQSSR